MKHSMLNKLIVWAIGQLYSTEHRLVFHSSSIIYYYIVKLVSAVEKSYMVWAMQLK